MQARRSILISATAAVLAVCVLAGAAPAHACACCSNTGQRMVDTKPVDDFAAGVLSDVQFAPAAQLYTGEADVGTLGGIATKSTDFRLAVTKGDGAWEFHFKDGAGGGGLTFALPKAITRFEVDPREPIPEPGTGPVLYKEWRLTAPAVGSGIFKGATGGDQRATLILHGRGNSCTDASQFDAWTLVLHGSKATNTLFGSLTGP
jgi:hypothetical protein